MLYNNRKIYEIDLNKWISFATATRSTLRNKCIQSAEMLFNELYYALIKEVVEDIKHGKTFYDHGLKNLILLKCPYYAKLAIELM